MNFGIECELASGTAGVIEHLGLDYLHCYHCECESCEPFRDGPDWTAQSDCTADGEIISRVLRYGSEEASEAIASLAGALRTARATHSTSQGLHVHVGTEDMTPGSWVRFWRLWFRYQDDIARLAAGKYDNVRTYNRRVKFSEVVGAWDQSPEREFWSGEDALVAHRIGEPYGREAWVNPSTNHDTVEFRLWNATRVEWRIHLAVGISVAMVQASLDENVRVRRNDERSLFDIIHPYLTPQSTAALLRATIHQERNAA